MKSTKFEKVANANIARIEKASKELEQLASKPTPINQLSIQLVQDYKQGKDITPLLYRLTAILALSRCKRINNKNNGENTDSSYSPFIVAVQKAINSNLTSDKKQAKINTWIDSLATCEKGEESEIMQRIATYGAEALPLLHDLIAVVLEYLAKVDITSMPDSYLLDTIEHVDMRSKYYHNGEKRDSRLWKKTATSPIKETSKKVSKYIDSQRAIKENEKLFCELTVIDDETGEEVAFYNSMPVISAVDILDFNGKKTTTVSLPSFNECLTLICTKCRFSPREKAIFIAYYCNGKTVLQIAEKIEITESAVKTYIDRIRDKIIRSEVFAEYGYIERKTESIIIIPVVALDKNGIPHKFESIGEASKALNISKGNISKCLTGERKTAGGYSFKHEK